MIMPSFTDQILSGSAFFLGSRNLVQPVKSLPLKSLIQPLSSARLAATVLRTASASADSMQRFMVHPPGNKACDGTVNCNSGAMELSRADFIDMCTSLA